MAMHTGGSPGGSVALPLVFGALMVAFYAYETWPHIREKAAAMRAVLKRIGRKLKDHARSRLELVLATRDGMILIILASPVAYHLIDVAGRVGAFFSA